MGEKSEKDKTKSTSLKELEKYIYFKLLILTGDSEG